MSACTRCKGPISTRTPSEGTTMQVVLTKTTVSWRLRLRRFHWAWLPEDPGDRVRESYTTLDLCDWCAGDVFLFAQGMPLRDPSLRKPTYASATETCASAPSPGAVSE